MNIISPFGFPILIDRVVLIGDLAKLLVDFADDILQFLQPICTDTGDAIYNNH